MDMNNNNWLLYGANGYTGRLILEEAKKTGLKPIIAGRNENEIKKLAQDTQLEFRIFSLDSLDELRQGLEQVDLVVNCAGPFIFTIDMFLTICLEKKIHYFDITGEIEVFEKAYAVNEQAVSRGVVICPGMGFDVVPTDCVAFMLKEKLNGEAHSLELAFHAQGGISQGTRKTAMLGGSSGVKIRRNGSIETVRYGELQKEIHFSHKTKLCSAISWGDVFTAYISTGAPSVTVYAPLPKSVKRYGKFSFLLKFWITRFLIKKFFLRPQGTGPSAEVRSKSKSYIWGRIEGKTGFKELRLITPNGYSLTAKTVIAGILKFSELSEKKGYFTPASLFGSDFVLTIADVTLVE